MNANAINLQTNFKIPKSGYHSIKQDKYDDTIRDGEINSKRPAQAISFSGSAVSLAQKAGNAFVQSDKINKLVYFVNDNEVAFTAIYSLIIAGILKPGLVLAQTGFDDKDGQMIATKNFLQAFIGSFLSFTVGGKFIKKIYDTMSNNLHLLKTKGDKDFEVVSPDNQSALKIAKKSIEKEHSTLREKWQNARNMASNEQGLWGKTKAFMSGIQKSGYKPQKEEIALRAEKLVNDLEGSKHLKAFNRSEASKSFVHKLVKNIEDLDENPVSFRKNAKNALRSQPIDSFESFWKRSTEIFTTIGKAKLSSILLPVVVGTLFAKKNLEAQANKENQKQSLTSTMAVTNSIKNSKEFSAITGADSNNKAQNVSFKGGLDTVIDNCALGIEKLATTKFFSRCTDALAKLSKKPSARMSDFESFGLTAYWVYNTQRSKKIDPDQKLGLNTHTVLVTLVSSAAAFILDAITDPLVNKAEDIYCAKLQDGIKDAQKQAQNPNSTVEQLQDLVKQGTSKLYGAKNIADKLGSKEVLSSDKNIQKEVENLAYTYSKKLSKCKSLLIFTLVVRFLVPVLTVKSSKKIKQALIEYSKNRKHKPGDKKQAA